MSERPIIYVRFADNGNLRKWAFVPFEGATGYRAMDQRPDGGGLDDGPPLPRKVVNEWRNKAIRSDFEKGAKYQDIADRYGISRPSVHAIVRGEQ